MSRYRRNGTPIGRSKVYIVRPGDNPEVWEVSGYQTWEELDAGLQMEMMSGRFGNPGGLVVLRPKVVARHVRLPRVILSMVDLSEANLVGADFSNCSLSGVSLRKSNLYGAHFRNAKIDGEDLSEVNLAEAHLSLAKIRGAYMVKARLSSAHLFQAEVKECNLMGADLSYSDMRGTDLEGTDLSGANLEGARRFSDDSRIPGWKIVQGVLVKL